MSQTINPHNKLSPQELAKHLRQPEGETGKEVGLQMNKGNKHICLNTYKVLAPGNNNHILEIGMGNGFFVKEFLQMADNLKYTGIDFSQAMIEEAMDINKELITEGKVQFIKASIEKLPIPDSSVDSITTTNTIYFWPQPNQNILELYRVLKPGGKVLIAYRPKSFMDKLELTQFGFTKYEQNEVENILANAGFKQISTEIITEPEMDFGGSRFSMEGMFTSGIKA